jgi:hypothetical protein
MKWFNKLERRFGRFAIDNLMTYIVALTGVVFLLELIHGGVIRAIGLYPRLVAQGEVWRLITYIFIPPTYHPIFLIFALYLYYMIGNSLNHEWGSFRFNLYYLIGMIGTTIGAYLSGGPGTAVYLNLSLFLAFARLYPNFELRLMFFIPVKIKYLAWVNWAYFGYMIIFGPLVIKLTILAAVANYLIFFGAEIFRFSKTQRQVAKNRKRFNAKHLKLVSMHKCTVCGITEHDNPNMEFRYCSKCEGAYEYCMRHLGDHQHKTSQKVEH